MGNITYSLQPEVISYHRPQDYNAFGERRVDLSSEENEIDMLHRSHCEEIFRQRRANNEKRKLLTTISNEDYARRFPEWSADDIGDYKIQFEIFDLNRDGVIDFKEMNSVLDEFGEVSTHNERWTTFKQLDTDNSNTIDFEEFLVVMQKLHRIATGKSGGADENINNIVCRGKKQVSKLRRMSVYKQLTNGIF